MSTSVLGTWKVWWNKVNLKYLHTNYDIPPSISCARIITNLYYQCISQALNSKQEDSSYQWGYMWIYPSENPRCWMKNYNQRRKHIRTYIHCIYIYWIQYSAMFMNYIIGHQTSHRQFNSFVSFSLSSSHTSFERWTAALKTLSCQGTCSTRVASKRDMSELFLVQHPYQNQWPYASWS